MKNDVLRVAGNSPLALVAGAIAGQIREKQQSDIQAIGMVAAYRMLKSVITAQKFLEAEGVQIVCAPRFVEVDIDEERCTAIRLTICAHRNGVL